MIDVPDCFKYNERNMSRRASSGTVSSQAFVSVEVQVPVYGIDAVYKASYTFLDRAYIRLEGDPGGTISVKIRLKNEAIGSLLESIAGEFENELIHQALRARVSSANQKIREYIVTRALASAEGAAASCAGNSPEGAPPESVLDEDLEKEIEKLLAEVEQQGGSDPLKITVPWQESAEEGRQAKEGVERKKDDPQV